MAAGRGLEGGKVGWRWRMRENGHIHKQHKGDSVGVVRVDEVFGNWRIEWRGMSRFAWDVLRLRFVTRGDKWQQCMCRFIFRARFHV